MPGELRGVRDELRRRGAHADLAEITDDCVRVPPYAARYIARAALEIRRHAPPQPVVLAARGAAGPLLPQIGAAQRAAHRPVAGYLIVDSLLPQPGSRTRTDLRAAQLDQGDPAADAAPGPWEERRGRETRERPPEFYTEQLPMASDWPDAPCGYLLTDDGPPPCARLARLRGWPVLDRTGSGTRAGTEGAAALADDLLELTSRL